MKQAHKGFTLVELMSIIVLLSALVIVTMPKYVDLSRAEHSAATSSEAAVLSSANSVNYVLRKQNKINGIAIANCTDLSAALVSGLPAEYSIIPASVARGANVTCILRGEGGTKANFVATGVD